MADDPEIESKVDQQPQHEFDGGGDFTGIDHRTQVVFDEALLGPASAPPAMRPAPQTG